MSRFNWVDVLAIILFFRMSYIGFQMGLFVELIKLVGLITGFFVSFRYYQSAGDWISARAPLSIEWSSAIAMVLLVALVYVAVSKLCQLLGKVMQISFQNNVSKIGGLLIGLVRAGLMTSVVLVVCRQLPSPYLTASIEERSLSGNVLSHMAPGVYDSVMPPLARSIKSWQGPSR